MTPPPMAGADAGRGGVGMWTYAYKHGDRPLEGYTIQRAAGRGGFGEVYYAVSDSGREVALKVITGFEQIELRGIGQCMNLKSPHLVSIFDIRQNAEGRWFVIMEFVNGPNLRELLDEAPAGLGPQKAAFFLREIAKGLSYLHDCGIVHRDLKPANIFFENGYVKIGDYGLSKAIEPTHHSGQTVTVGTVHYMAPEVGMGKYDRSIDIYALGALLYEMLTGIVPFVGASAGEILIKHLSHDADCSGIPEPFCSAIKRAMAKDPAQRFQTVQELVEAVFGAEHVRNSVSQFSPTDLSMVAGRIAERIAAPAMAVGTDTAPAIGASPAATIGGGSSVTSPNGLGTAPRGESMFNAVFRGAFGPSWTFDQQLGKVRRINSSIPGQDVATPAVAQQPAAPDSIPTPQRILLAIVATLVVATGAVAFDQPTHESAIWMFVMLSVLGGAVGLVFAARHWLPRPSPNVPNWSDRLALAAVTTAMSVMASAPIWMNAFEARGRRELLIQMHIAIVALAMACMKVRRWTDPARPERISFRRVIGAGFLAAIASALCDGNSVMAIAVVGGIALVAQVLASWEERGAAIQAAGPIPVAGRATPQAGRTTSAAQPAPGASHAVTLNAAPVAPPLLGVPPIPPLPSTAWSSPSAAASPRTATTTFGVFPPSSSGRPVPRWAVIVWFCASTIVLAFAVSMHVFVAATNFRNDAERGMFIAAMLVAYAVGAFCFLRMWKRVIPSWTAYLVLPLVRLAFANVFLACWAMIEFADVRNNEMHDMFSVVAAVFGIAWVVTWILPWLWRAAVPPPAGSPLGVSSTPSTSASSMPWASHVGAAAAAATVAAAARESAQSTAYSIGAAVAEVRSALRLDVNADDPTSRAERWRRKSRLRRVRWAGRDRDVDHAVRVAARFDRRRKRGMSRVIAPLAGLTLVAGIVLAFGVAIDAPAMIAAGIPDPKLASQIAREVFGGQVADWPAVAKPLLAIAAAILLQVGLVCALIARRQAGGAHMLRAVIAVAAFVLGLLPVGIAFASKKPWAAVAMLPVPVSQRAGWLAVRIVLDDLRPVELILSLVLTAFAVLMLALPPRRSESVRESARRAAAPASSPASVPASMSTAAMASAPPGGSAQ